MDRKQADMNLISNLVHSKDIWTLRAAVLASMLAPLGIDVGDILTTTEKSRLMGYLLRSGVTANVEGVEWTDADLLEIWRTPIDGEVTGA